MLTLLISCPKQHEKDIDVYLAPLVDDLKILWNDNVEMYDSYCRKTFTLKSVMLWTTNDFPAYGNMCGYTIKGYYAYPICGEGRSSKILTTHSRKMSSTGHRRFLPRHHPYRKQKIEFNDKDELDMALELVSGEKFF